MSKPTPGSNAAIDAGCTCPVLDNHHGKGFLWDGAPVFWITEGCPLHGKARHDDDDDGRGKRDTQSSGGRAARKHARR